MVRILNKRITGMQKVIAAKPQRQAFGVKGRAFVLDVNSLLLLEAKDIHQAVQIATNIPEPNMLINAVYAPYREKPSIKPVQKLALNLTQECNLRCSYCFSRHEKGTMGQDTINKALSLLRRAGAYDISFFGGEPLIAMLELELGVLKAEALAREYAKTARFHVTTNATLIDEGIASYLAGHGFTAIVSLDGPEAIHNALRRASWKETIEGLRCLNRHGMKDVTLRATYTPECLRLAERAEFLFSLQDQGLAANFSIEPASGQAWDRDALAEAYDELGNWYVEKMHAGKQPQLFHFNLYLERMANARPYISACGAGNAYVAVGPNGTIYACHRQGESMIGHVNTGISEELQAKWLDNRFYNHEECNECWARHLCGGGCREAHCQESGEHLWPGTLCIPTKAIIRQCAWILAELRGGPNAASQE